MKNSQFGRITYDIIGDDSAPVYFSVDSNTGAVRIADTLTQENVNDYRVSACIFTFEKLFITFSNT